jgi:hypothetical protein
VWFHRHTDLYLRYENLPSNQYSSAVLPWDGMPRAFDAETTSSSHFWLSPIGHRTTIAGKSAPENMPMSSDDSQSTWNLKDQSACEGGTMKEGGGGRTTFSREEIAGNKM